jgi:hypothetical protein
MREPCPPQNIQQARRGDTLISGSVEIICKRLVSGRGESEDTALLKNGTIALTEGQSAETIPGAYLNYSKVNRLRTNGPSSSAVH